ncbi:MAG: hypothetical protein IJA15_06815 [Clostridia bacterium]|nr:hypothetical protein [Clostridia bacterium]
MMKKLLALLLALLTMFSIVACGGDDPQDSYVEPDEYTKDGKLKIEFFGVDFDSLQSKTTDTQLIMDVIENKFNVSFSILNGSAASWKQQLSQRIGGGDVPDIFFHTKNEPAYSTWLESKYLFNYSEMLDAYPNLKAAFNRFPVNGVKAMLGGDYYSYPIVMDQTTDSNVINEHALYYRRDWYTNLVAKNWTPSSGRALVDPEDPNFNYNNFYDLCEGFTKGDPDNNGKDDTYGYSLTKDGGVYWWYPLLSMHGVLLDGWEKDANGKWVPEALSDKMKEAVMWIADMYDNGFINSNYATTTTQTVMKNNFVNGQAGMMTYNATFPMGKGVLDLMEQYAKGGKVLSDVVRAMPVVTGSNGKKQVFGYPNFYGFLAINNDVSENKKKTILSIMDWMLTAEGMQLLNYGIEGTHYKMEGGQLVSLLGKDEAGYPKTLYDLTVAPGIYRIKSLVSWSTIIPTTIEHYEEQMQLLTAWERKYLVVDELSYVSADTSFALKISALEELKSDKFQEIVNKISGASTADAKRQRREEIWNDFVTSYKRQGDTYITEINEKAKSQLGL